LHNREIVLSKLMVRLANLALMLTTGLPLFAVLQFLGGVDPDLVLAGLLATALTIASPASLGLLNSVYSRKTPDAILYTYLEVAAYLLLSAFGQLVHSTSWAAWTFDSGSLSVSVGDAANWFGAGNPVLILEKVITSIRVGGLLAPILPGRLRDYAL